MENECSPDVAYIGEGRYRHNPRGIRSTRPPGNYRQSKPLLGFSGCFNCGSMNHFARNFLCPLNLVNTSRRRIEFHRSKQKDKAAHTVLTELCNKFAESFASLSTEDVEIFDELLLSMSAVDDGTEAINSSCTSHDNRAGNTWINVLEIVPMGSFSKDLMGLVLTPVPKRQSLAYHKYARNAKKRGRCSAPNNQAINIDSAENYIGS